MKSVSLYLLSTLTLVSGAVIRREDICNSTTKVLYFLENDPAGANIVSIEVSEDGSTLSNPQRTSTGGNGLIGLTSTGPATVDSMFAQDAVVVSSNYLFTVNPGSATLSMFTIPSDDPMHPVLVGKPIATGGDFPNTVAYSPKHSLVCTANSGANSGISCFSVSSKGLSAAGSFMSIPINQTTPPLGPASTFSDAVFNPSESALFVNLKSDGMTAGSIYAFPISGKKNAPISLDAVRISKPTDLVLPFSFNFISNSAGVITDPSYGASFVSISCDLTVSVTSKITVAGQGATCWSAYSPAHDAMYIFDGGVNNITVLDVASQSIRTTITGSAGAGGSFDSVVNGNYLYVLEASAGVAVYDLTDGTGINAGQAAQGLNLTSMGDRATFEGLAMYMAA